MSRTTGGPTISSHRQNPPPKPPKPPKPTISSHRKVGATQAPCPLKGTLVVEVKRRDGQPLSQPADVSAQGPTPGNGPTVGTTDRITFPDRDKGEYTVTVTPKKDEADFEVKQISPAAPDKVNVPGGGSATAIFELVGLAMLKVKVTRTDNNKGVAKAKVKPKPSSSAALAEKTTAGEEGLADYGKVKADTYDVTMTLDPADAPKFKESTLQKNGEVLEDGKEKTVEFKVTPIIRIYLKPLFKDPEADTDDKARSFPKDFKCKMVFNTDGPAPKNLILRQDGILAAEDAADKAYIEVERTDKTKSFTLDFQQDEKIFIKCEKLGETTKKQELVKDADLDRTDLTAFRAFMLPQGKWTLKNSDWKVTGASTYDTAKYEFSGLDADATVIGTTSAPVKLILDPHWQFLRFEFMDRMYGHKEHNDKNVSIPPVEVTGFRVLPAKAKVATAASKAALAATAQGNIFRKQSALWTAQDKNDRAQAEKVAVDFDHTYWTNRKTEIDDWITNNPGHADMARVQQLQIEANAKKLEYDNKKLAADGAATNATNALGTAQSQYNTAVSSLGTKQTDADSAYSTAESEAASAKEDTDSNWYLEPDSKPENRVQCLPWIVNKKDNGDAEPKPDEDSLIQFKTDANTYIQSKSATERVLVKLDPSSDKLNPGVERFKYYDLPAVWKSQKYYARITPASGAAKQNRFEQLAKEATKAKEPMAFCLDDIVLAEEDGTPLPDWEWSPDSRIALFCNRFTSKKHDNSDDANLTKEGLYKADAGGSAHLGYMTKKPTGTAAGTAGTNNVETNRNYIADYPKWTRLAIANGTLFDAFEKRTKDSILGVVGARAAARYVDPTRPISGVAMQYQRWDGSGWADVAHSNHRACPNKAFQQRPAIVKKNYFAEQAYYEARYAQRYNAPFDETKDGGTGRIDMALLRCCAVITSGSDTKEKAINLHYVRNYFEFIGGALTGKSISDAETWKETWTKNVIARWNGTEDGSSTRTPNNKGRARILPRAAGSVTAPPMEVEVMWFGQCLPQDLAQFHVRVEDKGADSRDNRGGYAGTGESSPEGYRDSGAKEPGWFASAHESGHADSLPDEYNERWDGASYGQISLKSNLPGDPYELDGRVVEYQENDTGMMNGNRLLRNRYFWNSAEWVRVAMAQAPMAQDVRLKVGYDTFQEYFVPIHGSAGAGRTFAYWPIQYQLGHVKPNTRGKCDLYLVTHGAEHYSKVILPSYETPPAAPNSKTYDGVLVVAIKLNVTLPAFTGGSADNNRKGILQAMTAAAGRLSYKFILKGKARGGSDQEWTFARALLFFSPRYVVVGGDGAEGIKNRMGTYFDVVVVQGAATVTASESEWIAADKKPEVMLVAAWNTDVTGLTFTNKGSIGTKLGEYHGLDANDLEARIAKLGEIIPLCDTNETVAELDTLSEWETRSKYTPSSRSASSALVNLDGGVSTYEGLDKTDYDGRINQLETVKTLCQAYVDHVSTKNKITNPALHARIPHARTLKDIANNKQQELKKIRPQGKLKKQAEDRKAYLERLNSSTTLQITCRNGADANQRKVDVQTEFGKRLPEMLGLYKPSASVVKADVEKVLGKTSSNAIPDLGLTNASVDDA